MPAGQPPSAYGNFMRVIRELNTLVQLSQLPAALGAQVFIEDPQKRKELLRILDALQTMTGAPLVVDQTAQATRDVRMAPDKRQALSSAARNVGGEALLQSIPVLRAVLSEALG